MMSGAILPTSIKYSSKETNSGDGRLQQKPWVPMKGQEIGSYIEVSFNDQIGTFTKVHFQGGSLGDISFKQYYTKKIFQRLVVFINDKTNPLTCDSLFIGANMFNDKLRLKN
jgi:hypothetical protein